MGSCVGDLVGALVSSGVGDGVGGNVGTGVGARVEVGTLEVGVAVLQLCNFARACNVVTSRCNMIATPYLGVTVLGSAVLGVARVGVQVGAAVGLQTQTNVKRSNDLPIASVSVSYSPKPKPERSALTGALDTKAADCGGRRTSVRPCTLLCRIRLRANRSEFRPPFGRTPRRTWVCTRLRSAGSMCTCPMHRL